MLEHVHEYVIVGGGLAGASAIDGIREVDAEGSIALIAAEHYYPYHRPPLSKKLWFGKQTVDKIWVNKEDYYSANGVDVALGTNAAEINPANKTVRTDAGDVFHYKKLLIAAGASPRRLPIPGGELDGICYLRYLADYEALKAATEIGKSALVIGGGFIGSEIAAALNINSVEVTMVFPEDYICNRVFPESLGLSIHDDYILRGIKLLSGDSVASIEKDGSGFKVQIRSGKELKTDMIIAGIGVEPELGLAHNAGLETQKGILVNEYLQTSSPDVYAAGDCATFPYQALGALMRLEHWDNALNQGKQAGRNMAGAGESYAYMPYFFSDLFDFGYEAVGEVDTRLDIFADWQEENKTGVIYYLRDGAVRGAMMCNVWDQAPAARELIKSGKKVDPKELRGAIR
ncbi:MAG: FAD-dependent oxidoreductase [Armatimonadetes bacterium]|jgi:NADPH-dependent 2,4-dienoyl-CoA reductase/sulfur reductase-like enzyme|nr:FAD-dependent oxidoreductase [Armatimonadota bacterium]